MNKQTSCFPARILYVFPITHACYNPRQYHPPWFIAVIFLVNRTTHDAPHNAVFSVVLLFDFFQIQSSYTEALSVMKMLLFWVETNIILTAVRILDLTPSIYISANCEWKSFAPVRNNTKPSNWINTWLDSVT